MKDLKSNGVGGSGLSDADKSFLKELTNETRDAITDMRIEVLTASDKSEFAMDGNLNFLNEIKYSPLALNLIKL